MLTISGNTFDLCDGVSRRSFLKIGGLAMGAFSDRHGRKRALQLSVVAMSGAPAAIGLLPTYAMAGSLATCLLVLCRLVQGLSVRWQRVPNKFGGITGSTRLNG